MGADLAFEELLLDDGVLAEAGFERCVSIPDGMRDWFSPLRSVMLGRNTFPSPSKSETRRLASKKRNIPVHQIDKETFRTNLLLTQHYCDWQIRNTEKNTASILRSIHSNNLISYRLEEWGTPESPTPCFLTTWHKNPTDPDNHSLMIDLFNNQIEHKRQFAQQAHLHSKINGRIMAVEIDYTVTDGAAAVASNGLMDDYDYPPIDTWFYLASGAETRILFSWIPEPFVKTANNGVLVHCLDIIHWLEKWDPETYQAFMAS